MIDASEANLNIDEKKKEIKNEQKQEEDDYIMWGERSLLSKVDFVIELPFEYLRKITIPRIINNYYNFSL